MTEDNTKHTPGPWVVGTTDKTLIGGLRGFSYSNIAQTIVIPAHGHKKHAIAEANARLIAAAPEMLAALTRLANDDWECHWHCEQTGDRCFCWQEIVQDAIAKAEPIKPDGKAA